MFLIMMFRAQSPRLYLPSNPLTCKPDLPAFQLTRKSKWWSCVFTRHRSVRTKSLVKIENHRIYYHDTLAEVTPTYRKPKAAIRGAEHTLDKTPSSEVKHSARKNKEKSQVFIANNCGEHAPPTQEAFMGYRFI